MHAKFFFPHRLQRANKTYFRTGAQNKGPTVQSVLLEGGLL